jgi:hypothetical protein
VDARILNFKKYESGALAGFFDLEMGGLTYLGCKCFRKGDSLWFQFPAQKSTDAAGEVKYTPIITASTATMRALQDAVRDQLRACMEVTTAETRPFGGPAPRPSPKPGRKVYKTPENEDLSAYRSEPGEDIPF